MKIKVIKDFKWYLNGDFLTFSKDNIIDVDSIIADEMCKYNYAKRIARKNTNVKKSEVKEEMKEKEKSDFENKMIKMDYNKKKLKKVKIIKQKKIGEK